MSEVISPKNCMTGMLRVNTVGTIFWYLWSPLVFFDETLGSYVIEVEKKDPEVELPVGGRTSGFQEIAVYRMLTRIQNLHVTAKSLLFNLYSTVNVIANHLRTLSRLEQIIAIGFGIHADCIGQASCCLPVLITSKN